MPGHTKLLRPCDRGVKSAAFRRVLVVGVFVAQICEQSVSTV